MAQDPNKPKNTEPVMSNGFDRILFTDGPLQGEILACPEGHLGDMKFVFESVSCNRYKYCVESISGFTGQARYCGEF